MCSALLLPTTGKNLHCIRIDECQIRASLPPSENCAVSLYHQVSLLVSHRFAWAAVESESGLVLLRREDDASLQGHRPVVTSRFCSMGRREQGDHEIRPGAEPQMRKWHVEEDEEVKLCSSS